MAPRVALVVAMARNGVIGRGNGLPWTLPEDLRRFKATTMGKPLLMGRKTHESIGRPLPGRLNVVLTRDQGWRAPGVSVVHTLAQGLDAAGEAGELMVIGGAEIYRLVMPRAHRIYLTRVQADVAGDTYFPPLDPQEWVEVARDDYPADERNAFPLSFVTLERGAAPQTPRPH